MTATFRPPAQAQEHGRAPAPSAPRPVIRVCVVAPSLRIVGGQSIQADRLLRHLQAADGFEAGLVPHNPRIPGPLGRVQDVKIVRTIVTTLLYVASLLVRLPRYDVVHVFSASYWSYLLGPLPAILVARLLGKPVILNYRSGELEDHLTRWPRWVARSMGLATIITPSPYMTEVYAKFGLRASVIPNYLDLDARRAFRPRDPVRPVVLVNRNFMELYDYPCALEAFRLVQAQVPEAHLIVAGGGPLRDDIVRWIEEKGLRNVSLRGSVSQDTMLELYREADVYLNTPRLDCFPSSILDAFATGAVVVTTDAGGIPYIVEHGRTGWVAPIGDAEGLARGVLTFLGDPERAREAAAAGRRELEHRYVWPVVGPQWERTYAELTAARR